MGKPEGEVERYLKKRCNEHGFFCYKFSSPGTAGMPDRIIGGEGFLCFVETKKPGAVPRKLQQHYLKELRKTGVIACAIDSKERVDEFVRYISDQSNTDPPEWIYS